MLGYGLYRPSKKPKARKIRRKRFPAWVYAAIVAKQHGLCACGCEEPLGADPRDIEFDHEHELAIGGADTPDNIRALKKRHHLDKTRANAAKIAKARRIEANGGHRRRNLSAADRELANLLESDHD